MLVPHYSWPNASGMLRFQFLEKVGKHCFSLPRDCRRSRPPQLLVPRFFIFLLFFSLIWQEMVCGRQKPLNNITAISTIRCVKRLVFRAVVALSYVLLYYSFLLSTWVAPCLFVLCWLAWGEIIVKQMNTHTCTCIWLWRVAFITHVPKLGHKPVAHISQILSRW